MSHDTETKLAILSAAAYLVIVLAVLVLLHKFGAETIDHAIKVEMERRR